MNLKALFFLGLLTSGSCFAQWSDFGYKREIKDINSQWHSIDLSPDILSKVQPDLSDVRIYGITTKNDTIEAPYIAKIEKGAVLNSAIPVNIINSSKVLNTYFFTLETSSLKTSNTIELDFSQTNFDWNVTLEGSQNLNNWYSILTDYRIVSIENDLESYNFTKLSFPDSKYKYYRVSINSNQNIELLQARIYNTVVLPAKFNSFQIKNIDRKINKANKQSVIDITLDNFVPINQIQFFIANKFDYYRPFKVQYIADSIQTPKGIKYIYNTVSTGILSSLEQNIFNQDNFVTDKFRVVIDNYNNKPITIDSVQVKGYQHKLTARFDDEAIYYLVYANVNAYSPDYDIKNFKSKIPNATEVSLGNEQIIPQKIKNIEVEPVEPIFKNKIWLWVIMFLIATLLGWASYNMLKKQE